MKKRLLLFPLLVVLAKVTYGQNDLTLSFMENIFQSTYVNPTATPVYKVSIGLPGISSLGAQITNTGFSYGDVIKRYPGKDSAQITDAVGKLDKENYFYTGFQTDLFHVRVKVHSYYFSVFAQEKFQSRFSYPSVFADFVWNGNKPYIGQTADFKNFGYDFDWYRTIGVGIAKEWKHWVVGANLKYLGGIANANLDAKNSGIRIEDGQYAFSSKSDIILNTSGLPYDNDTTFEKKYFDNESTTRDYLSPFKNPGAAIDAAVTYKPNDKWHFTFAIINFGYINWKTDVYNRKITGGKDFRGLDIFGDLLRDSLKSNDEYTDQFKNAFQYTTSQDSYKKWLVPQFYLTGKYNITYKTHLGVLNYWEYYKKWRPALTLSLYHKFGRVFNIVGTYNIQYNRYDNVGLGLMLKGGPFQLYVGGDNLVTPVIRWASEGFEVTKKVVDPIKTFNIRVGLNLVFGKVNEPSRQSYEYQKEDEK